MKDSEKKLSGKPQLVAYYTLSMEDVYGVYSRVARKLYDRFFSKEKELIDKGVTPKDYAYGVAIMLEKWVKDKGFSSVPVNVFLGSWAWNKFMKVHDSVSVRIDNVTSDEDVGLLWSELLVARTYIQSSLVDNTRLSDVVEDLRPLLSESWLELYEKDDRMRLETLALMQLENEYMVKCPNSYSDIVTALVLNGHS